jgi:hypothetical protein
MSRIKERKTNIVSCIGCGSTNYIPHPSPISSLKGPYCSHFCKRRDHFKALDRKKKEIAAMTKKVVVKLLKSQHQTERPCIAEILKDEEDFLDQPARLRSVPTGKPKTTMDQIDAAIKRAKAAQN